jgi:hypothetical protein
MNIIVKLYVKGVKQKHFQVNSTSRKDNMWLVQELIIYHQ